MALQYPKFYKPDQNNPTVVDVHGNPVSLEQYKLATGQQSVPNEQLNWSYVQSGSPQTDPQVIEQSLSFFFTPEEMASIPSNLKTELAALGDYLKKQYELGQTSVEISADNFAKALQAAKTDPDIQAKYGESLATARRDLEDTLGIISGQFTQEDLARKRTFDEQARQLAEQEAAAGRAYSGFREQAKQRLSAEQSDIIQSSRRQLQQNIRQLGSQFEKQFGTPALQSPGVPQLTVQSPPNTFGTVATYQPYGNLRGSNVVSREAEERARAGELFQTVTP